MVEVHGVDPGEQVEIAGVDQPPRAGPPRSPCRSPRPRPRHGHPLPWSRQPHRRRRRARRSPRASRVRTALISSTPSGVGEAITRRCPRCESSAICQPRSCASCAARSALKNGPIGLVGCVNAGSSGSTVTCVTTVTARPWPRWRSIARTRMLPSCPCVIAQSEYNGCPGTSAPGLVLLDGQVSHLRAVAVDDGQSPAGVRELGEAGGEDGGVRLDLRDGADLVRRGQGVSADGDHRGGSHPMPPPRRIANDMFIIVNSEEGGTQCTEASRRHPTTTWRTRRRARSRPSSSPPGRGVSHGSSSPCSGIRTATGGRSSWSESCSNTCEQRGPEPGR